MRNEKTGIRINYNVGKKRVQKNTGGIKGTKKKRSDDRSKEGQKERKERQERPGESNIG